MALSILPLALPVLLALPADVEQDQAPAADPGAAIHAIEAGDYGKARTILTQLLSKEALTSARSRMDAGQPLDALPTLDEVLSMDPRNAAAWSLRGTAALAAADQGHQQAFLYGDALQSFEKALRYDAVPISLFGASRAALMSSELDKALGYARQGMDSIAGQERPVLPVDPERAWSEAAFFNYVSKKRAEEDTSALKDETERSLGALIGRQPEDAWPWIKLAELYQWEQQNEVAADRLAIGLRFLPEDQQLHQKHAEILRSVGGRQAVVDAYQAFNEKHPDNALGIWYQALELLYVGIDDLLASKDGTANFERAESMFVQCRELKPEFNDQCISWELICRNGLGWCRFNNEDYVGAEAAFLSMEEHKEGGLEWQLEGSLFSGVRGLEFVADRYARVNSDADSLAKAAEIFDYLRFYRPEDPNFANNSGFFHRDAGVAMEVQAMLALRDASQAATEEEQASLQERAQERRARAQELMLKSYDAYVAASALAPEDVRVVNDTGLIMTYYVRTDVAAAERYLNQAISNAEIQIPALEAEIARARAAVEAERAQADQDAAEAVAQAAAAAETESEAAASATTETEGAQTEEQTAPEEGAEQVPAEVPQVSEAEQRLIDLEDQLDQLLEAYADAFENFGILYLTLTGEPDKARTYLERCAEIGPHPRVPRRWVKETVLPICDAVAAGDLEAVKQLTGRVWLHAPQAK